MNKEFDHIHKCDFCKKPYIAFPNDYLGWVLCDNCFKTQIEKEDLDNISECFCESVVRKIVSGR